MEARQRVDIVGMGSRRGPGWFRLMELTFERVSPDQASVVAAFLCGEEWPFHGTARLSAAEAELISVSGADTRAFWIHDAGNAVGLVRLLDLDDVDDGSPLFDLRIASGHRGRGVGTAAVTWLSDYLFVEFPALHRVEATTRGDNAAMIAVLERCGYRHEGVLREAWKSSDGSYHDTMIYGLLRHEWSDVAAE
jgi:RimJ/RimL family protein N-acetyltransferase